MSFRIGGFLPSLGSDNAVSTPPLVANKPAPEPYLGGTLSVTVKPGDTPESFVHRGLHDHAIKAGLDETEANKFADQWTNKKTTFNHRADGRSVPYTPTEFTELKTGTSATFDLDPEFDSAILTDLNSRVEDSRPIQAEQSFAYTPDERRAIMALKGEGVSQCEVAGKPDMMLTSGTTRDGKPLTAEVALGRYIERHFNQDRRVKGDITLQMVREALEKGVEVNLQIDPETNTALVGVSASDKQKLEVMFNDALDITMTGERGSLKGQREGTRMAADIPITMINAVNKAIEGTASIPSFLEDVAKSEAQRMITPPGIGAFPAVEAMIPKVTDVLPKAIPAADLSGFMIPNQSDLFNRDITGKVNPNGQTLGKTAATITGAVIPIPLANAKTVQVTGRVAGEIADAAIRGGTNVARKVEQFGQEAAAGMRTFGQPEFVTAGGAPVRATPLSSKSPLDTLHDPMDITRGEYLDLRSKSPTKKIQDAVNADGLKTDPVYGYPVERLEADHIVSLKEITEMKDFDKLTKAQQIEVVNLGENFIGLGKSTNASKGAKSWKDWEGHSKLGEVPAEVRQRMIQLENEARTSVQNAIQERVILNQGVQK